MRTSAKKIITVVIVVLVLVISLLLFFRYKTYSFADIVGASDTRIQSIIVQRPESDSGPMFQMNSETIDIDEGNASLGRDIEEVFSRAKFRISKDSNFYDEEGQMIFVLSSDNLLLLSRNGLLNLSGDRTRCSMAAEDLEKIVNLLSAK